GQQGSVEVDAALEKHWTAWNGQYALFVRHAIAVRTSRDLARLHLLVPAFEYGKPSARQGKKLHDNAMRFARDAGMGIEEEPRFEFFRARFLSDPAAVAFMPDNMAKALAFDSATGFQRLALVRSSN